MVLRVRKGVILRKLVHILLSVPLLLPVVMPEASKYLPVGAYYAIMTVVTCLAYAAYVKREVLSQVFSIYLDNIRQVLNRSLLSVQSISTTTAIVQHMKQAFAKVENHLKELIELAERDYERRYSFIGILMGCVGVLCSYVLFNRFVLYGILTLIIYDSVSGLVGAHIGRHRIPGSVVTIEGAAAGAATLFTSLSLLHVNPIAALAISIAAVVGEAYGIEDNFTLPVVTSFIAFTLHGVGLL